MREAVDTKGSCTQSLEATENIIKMQRHEHFKITPLTLISEPRIYRPTTTNTYNVQ